MHACDKACNKYLKKKLNVAATTSFLGWQSDIFAADSWASILVTM